MQRRTAAASRRNHVVSIVKDDGRSMTKNNDDDNDDELVLLANDDDDNSKLVLHPATKSAKKNYRRACIMFLLLLMAIPILLLWITTQSHTAVGIEGMKDIIVSTKEKIGGAKSGIRRRRRSGRDVVVDGNHDDDNDVLMTTSPATNATLHIVFSTDCGSFQHWQSYLFFHSAYKIHQPGYITRIVSGCTTPEERNNVQTWHDAHVRTRMSDRYRIHFTPHFSTVKDEDTGEYKDYKFFNKPFGLKHFIEHNELMGFENESSGIRRLKHPDDIIILADPDFILLRHLTDDFSNEKVTIISNRRQSIFQTKETHFVTRGNPYAQTYGLGAQWRKFDIDAIAGANSPAKTIDQSDGVMYYPAGPPYMAVASDMYAISEKWSEFAPKVYKQYPHLLAEMYAYCIAAAHLQLPHMLVDSLMISAIGVGGEGWKFIREIPDTDICNVTSSNSDHSVNAVLPSVIHYCQRYGIDKYFWGKRKMNHDIFTCDHSLLIEPPSDLGTDKYSSVSPKGKPADSKLTAFMVCALTKATNDAMMYFKEGHCDGGGNMKKEYAMIA